MEKAAVLTWLNRFHFRIFSNKMNFFELADKEHRRTSKKRNNRRF